MTKQNETTDAGPASSSTDLLEVFEIPACLRSPARVQAEAVRKWIATPEGMAAIKEAGLAADATIKELDAARVIPWQALQEPFTI